MTWQPHGISSSGFLQESHNGQSKTVPAVAAYRGQLWCLWADMDDNIWYAVTHKDGQFGKRLRFPDQGLPVITNLNGHLHAIIARETGQMVHYLYDEDKCLWTSLDTPADAVTHSSPCLVAFHNKLFLVFRRDASLYHLIWTNSTSHSTSASEPQGSWSAPAPVSDDGRSFGGIPALCILNGVLHLLCGRSGTSAEILGYQYDYIASTWTPSADITEGRAASGVSATSYGDRAYLGFIESGPAPGADNTVYVASYAAGRWQPEAESVDGQTAADPPQIAILNGRIHCIFNSASATRDLRWYSRPVLSYSLSSWMASLPDGTALPDITVPGTHDSCARSNIPFVRTQYLSVAQQLAAGIRFLDLRLRADEQGELYCYHGGIPLGLPRGLSFASVMDEVWRFLAAGGSTETVLVSVNNDDASSPGQRADPGPFYRAVGKAIGATPDCADGGTARWFVEPVTPTLGRVRGRAVLLRRYGGDPGVRPAARQGLDLSEWVDDSPEFTIVTPTNVRVHLQDKWKYAERISLGRLVASKSGHVQRLMDRAAGTAVASTATVGSASSAVGSALDGRREGDDWFVNFCSAVGDPVEHGEIAEAKWIAVGAHSSWIGKWVDGMNVLTRDYVQRVQTGMGELQEGGRRGRLGIVNLDYPELPEDNDLVARLIEMNF